MEEIIYKSENTKTTSKYKRKRNIQRIGKENNYNGDKYFETKKKETKNICEINDDQKINKQKIKVKGQDKFWNSHKQFEFLNELNKNIYQKNNYKENEIKVENKNVDTKENMRKKQKRGNGIRSLLDNMELKFGCVENRYFHYKSKLNKYYYSSNKYNNLIIINEKSISTGQFKNVKIESKNNIIILSIYIIMIIIISKISKSNFSPLDESSITGSYIKIKIPIGDNIFLAKHNQYYDWGNLQFYNDYTRPNEIYINCNKISYYSYRYDFTEETNTVILIWNNLPTNCIAMFYGCDQIIEIDLSHFDTSEVTDMKAMFYDCFGLNSINLSNLKTSKVGSMRAMFFNCNSVNSLDLSYFNTQNIKSSKDLFNHCFKLYSLDLRNFDTSQVTEVVRMFDDCPNLMYINLENSRLSSGISGNDAFTIIPDKLIICSKDNKWKIGRLINIHCKMNSSNNVKYNCYTKESSLSFNEYVCDTCGNNYYEIDKDENNDNSNINCYKEPEGYYLYQYSTYSIYKQCYSTCKKCDEKGNDSDHKCKECKADYNYRIKKSNNNYDCFNKCDYYHYKEISSNYIYCTLDNTCPEDYNKLIKDKNECINDCKQDSIYIYEYENICYNTYCHPDCKECIGPYDIKNTKCSSCASDDKFLQEGNCVNQCSIGYYKDNKKCKKCHNNCLTCNSGEKYINKYLISMGCIKCKDNYILLEGNSLNEIYCFQIIKYEKTKITFDIHELDLLYTTTLEESCLYFNKSIFYDQYKCITKPKKTYYIINNEMDNTGIIKYCNPVCDTCFGPSDINNTNCISCIEGYYKTEDSNTNCILENLIPKNYYKNKSDNIFYKCYKTCSSCNNSIEINRETNGEIHNCLECIEEYYFIYGTNNCYNRSILNEGYYLLSNDSMYHKCGIQCETCFNTYENNNTNCIECNTKNGYYPINSIDEISSNCYNNESIKQGYYLNRNISPFKWEKCHERCDKCDKGSNLTNMNCLSCKTNLINERTSKFYYFNYSNGNCIETCPNNSLITPIGDCVFICPNDTYEYKLNNSCLEKCPNDYEINKQRNKCILKVFNEIKVSELENEIRDDITSYVNSCPNNYEINKQKNKCILKVFNEIKASELKNEIRDDITSYVNSSSVINGSDFIAVVLTSDDMDPKKQLKNGISAIDLGDCPDIIKKYYNISEDENLIILNIEYKNIKEIKNESEVDNMDNSFKLGKNIQLEIFDSSGRKLDLSICNKDIKVMKYIGDIEQLDIESAKNLAFQGIDVFNANDSFFNDICISIDIGDNKDIILTDRRKDIFQNVSFCQEGCIYSGMNYELMTANCLCNSSSLNFDEEKNGENNININEKEIVNFKTITKSFISSLTDFNFKVLECYNLLVNTKILINNIGFYCMGLMFLFQVLCFILYMIKKLKPIKNFMLIFKENKSEKSNIYFNSNNESIKNMLNNNKTKKTIDLNINKNSLKKYNKNELKFDGKIKNEINNIKFMQNNETINQNNNNNKIFSDNINNKEDNSSSKNKKNSNSSTQKVSSDKKLKTKKKNKIKKKLIDSCLLTPIINENKQCLNINSINKGISEVKKEYKKENENVNIDINKEKKIKLENKEKEKIVLNDNINENNEKTKNIELSYNKNGKDEKIYNLQTIGSKDNKNDINNKQTNKIKKKHFKSSKKEKGQNIFNVELLEENEKQKAEDKKKKYRFIKLSPDDSDLQDMDYKHALLYDKRSFLRMYWSSLVDSQIILGTFFTDSYLYLFVIKISFLIFTFQISFFLNALFYTDQYISDAYHNDGILNFFSGLPKSIYSCFVTILATNILQIFSNNQSQLARIIKKRYKIKNYMKVLNIKLRQLRNKLIIYFILLFSLGLFFLYYVTSFCAVYRYSQKYWFIGCLESFCMDTLVAIIVCIFISLFRYISITKQIKCFYIMAKIISTFL